MNSFDSDCFYNALGNATHAFRDVIDRICSDVYAQQGIDEIILESINNDYKTISDVIERILINAEEFRMLSIYQDKTIIGESVYEFLTTVEWYAPQFMEELKTKFNDFMNKIDYYFATMQELFLEEIQNFVLNAENPTSDEELLRVIDWQLVSDTYGSIPFFGFMLFPNAMPVNEITSKDLNTNQMVLFICEIQRYYDLNDNDKVNQAITNILVHCTPGYYFFSSFVSIFTNVHWNIISEVHTEALMRNGMIARWQHKLNWRGKALNEALTMDDISLYWNRLNLSSLFLYTKIFTEVDIMNFVFNLDSRTMRSICEAQPINKEIIDTITLYITNSGDNAVTLEYVLTGLQYNEHLTPALAYKYRHLFTSRRALELAGKYTAWMHLCNDDRLDTDVSKMIAEFGGL